MTLSEKLQWQADELAKVEALSIAKVQESRKWALRGARDAGLSVQKLADAIGVHRTTVYEWMGDDDQ